MTEAHKKWYEKNKTKRKKSIVSRQQSISSIIKSYKLDKGCAVCGYRICSSALHFHHIDHNKEANISRLVGQGAGPERIFREILKCNVLCANCHAEHHHAEASSSGQEHGLSSREPGFDSPCLYQDLRKVSTAKPQKVIKHCKTCAKQISPRATWCLSHRPKTQLSSYKIVWPSRDELLRDVAKYGYRAVGQKLGVSDNAIRKHLNRTC